MADQGPKGRSDSYNFVPAFDREGLPLCLSWTIEMVENWISNLGFPQYKACFSTNYINGRKLITIDASTLPKIGITDFEHMKIITASVRDLLDIENVEFKRSISRPPRELRTLFLERKSVTGTEIDALSYEEHLRELKKFYLHGVPEQHSF